MINHRPIRSGVRPPNATVDQLVFLCVSVSALIFVGAAAPPLAFLNLNLARYAFALLVLAMAVLIPRFRLVTSNSSVHILYISGFWALFTALWSEQTTLTVFKSLSLLLVISALVCGAYHVARTKQNYFWVFAKWLTVFGFLTTVFALLTGIAWNFRGPPLLKGIFGVSTTYGFLLVVSFAYLVYAYVSVENYKKRVFVVVALAVIVSALALNQSRSAYISILAFLFYSTFRLGSRRLFVLVFSSTLAMVALIYQTIGAQAFFDTYVMKYGTVDQGVFYSRTETFEETLKGARQGGLFGGGYGVSIGFEQDGFSGNLTAVGYGREKGNSQMAVVEEVGFVGFVLYLIFHARLLVARYSRNGRARTPSEISKSLVLQKAVLLGCVVHSIVEAWWVAPGSMQMAIFLVLTGAFLGEVDRTTRPFVSGKKRSRSSLNREQMTSIRRKL